MKIGKIIQCGESVGVIIPKAYMRELGWIRGDLLMQEIRGTELVIHNVTPRGIKQTHRTAEFRDEIIRRPGRAGGV